MKPLLLNVSRGQKLNFAANGKPVCGVVTSSHNKHPLFASVGVETENDIPNGAELTIPDYPEAGECGRAIPITLRNRVCIILLVANSVIECSTIGK
jgi:hypothetical protein